MNVRLWIMYSVVMYRFEKIGTTSGDCNELATVAQPGPPTVKQLIGDRSTLPESTCQAQAG